MDSLTQLETYANELVTAIKSLASHSRCTEGSANWAGSNPEAHKGLPRAKECILSNITKIKMLVCEPSGFLEHIASQVCLSPQPARTMYLETENTRRKSWLVFDG